MLGMLNDGTEAYISAMTKPQMIRCPGSGRKVGGRWAARTSRTKPSSAECVAQAFCG